MHTCWWQQPRGAVIAEGVEVMAAHKGAGRELEHRGHPALLCQALT